MESEKSEVSGGCAIIIIISVFAFFVECVASGVDESNYYFGKGTVYVIAIALILGMIVGIWHLIDWILGISKNRVRREAEEMENRARREAEEMENRTRCEAEEIKRMRELAKQNISEFIVNNHLLSSFLVIDSNIWMTRGYEPFFIILEEKCQSLSKELVLYGPQFDEICNIKKGTDFKEKKNSKSRMAIHRINEWSKKGILRVEPITIEAKQGAYADPLIVRLLEAIAKKGEAVCLLSDDKELQVRARERIRRVADTQFNVIGADSIRDACQQLSGNSQGFD